MLRFLPSMIVALALLIGMFVADRLEVTALLHDRRDKADTILATAQQRVEATVTSTQRSARRLADQIDTDFDIDQTAFADLVDTYVDVSGTLDRVELAPGFVTQIVHPTEGNEIYIGSSPIVEEGPQPVDPAAQLAHVVPAALTHINVSLEGRVEVRARAGVRASQQDTIVLTGLVSVVTRFDLDIGAIAGDTLLGPLDYFYAFQPTNAPPPDLPQNMQGEGDFEPMRASIRYPSGEFLFFLRPSTGWTPKAAEMRAIRIRDALLGLLVLLPVIAANWFAMRNQATRSDLSHAKVQMSGLLKNLPGSALTYTIPAGNTTPGDNDKVKFLNPQSCMKLWGVDAETVERNSSAIWDMLSSAKAREDIAAALIASMNTLGPLSMICPITTPTGERKLLFARGLPERLPDGAVRWMVLVVDQTEQYAQERELARQRALTYQAQKTESIGQLTGGIAHDFNNLLAVIIGNLELAIDEADDTEAEGVYSQKETLQAALSAAWRGGDLVKKMLAFARKSPLDPVVLDVNAIVKETEGWLLRAIPANVAVETNLQSRCWPVNLDAASLQSAIINTVVNARDAMPDGGKLTIETTNLRVDKPHADDIEEDVPPGRYVMLALTDTGTGIKEATLQKVFDPFFTTKAVGAGTGLGLSMVQGFVKQSGGFVRIYSELGSGTSIKMYFPAVDADSESIVTNVRPPVEAAEPTGVRVLLVDDKPEILDVLRRSLTTNGYEVETALNGTQALEMFHANRPYDLLITDIVMPGALQGPALARELRKIDVDLPAIFMSGYASEATVHGNGLRPEDIRLMKPVSRVNLLEAVDQALSAT
ncbi:MULTISPECIES: response regulator [unclassified Marinovum]